MRHLRTAQPGSAEPAQPASKPRSAVRTRRLSRRSAVLSTRSGNPGLVVATSPFGDWRCQAALRLAALRLLAASKVPACCARVAAPCDRGRMTPVATAHRGFTSSERRPQAGVSTNGGRARRSGTAQAPFCRCGQCGQDVWVPPHAPAPMTEIHKPRPRQGAPAESPELWIDGLSARRHRHMERVGRGEGTANGGFERQAREAESKRDGLVGGAPTLPPTGWRVPVGLPFTPASVAPSDGSFDGRGIGVRPSDSEVWRWISLPEEVVGRGRLGSTSLVYAFMSASGIPMSARRHCAGREMGRPERSARKSSIFRCLQKMSARRQAAGSADWKSGMDPAGPLRVELSARRH